VADDKGPVTPDEIDALLAQTDASREANDQAAPSSGGGTRDPAEIEALLNSVANGGGQEEPSEAGGTEDPDRVLAHPDMDQLLAQVGQAETATKRKPGEEARQPPILDSGEMSQADLEVLLNQAQQAIDSIDATPQAQSPPGARAFQLPELGGAPANGEVATLDLIRDVELDLKIELGRTHMYLEDVLKLRKGSVVPLDKLAGDPVDIYVNGRLIARGEVLVLNDNFCVRVAELLAGANIGK
jgi:flagellar motor switch protein FliN/FliY